MEKEILKVLLEYKKIKSLEIDFHNQIKEDLFKYKFKENKTGIISSLDSKLKNELDPFFSEIKSSGCDVVLTSGKRPPGTLKSSLHPHGKAVDIQPVKEECYCSIMNICTKYPKLFCLDERLVDTPDKTGPHIHIELKQSNKQTKPCSSSDGQKKGRPASTQSTQSTNTGQEDDNFTGYSNRGYDYATKFASKFLPFLTNDTENINEGIFDRTDYFSNVKNPVYSFGKFNFTPKNTNKILNYWGEGTVMRPKYDRSCVNSLEIEFDTDLVEGGLLTVKICNITNVMVQPGDSVRPNQILGTLSSSDDSIEYEYYDINRKSIYKPNKKSPKKEKKSDTKSKYNDEDNDIDYGDKGSKYKFYGKDPSAAWLFSLPFKALSKLTSPTSKNQPKPFFTPPTSKTQPKPFWKESREDHRIIENIERIKKLLS